MGRNGEGYGIVFRICDSETGKVIIETDNIHELADYLYNRKPKYFTVNINEEHVKKWQESKD